MRRTFTLKLPVLFVSAIVLPALVLAYLGLRAVGDERERVMEEQRRVAGLLRERFDGVIRHAIGELRRVAKPAGMDGTALGDLSSLFIEHAFVLDHEGRWIVPNVPGKRKATLSPQFRARMEAAGHLEFSVRDIAGALAMFRGIATRSKNRTRSGF